MCYLRQKGKIDTVKIHAPGMPTLLRACAGTGQNLVVNGVRFLIFMDVKKGNGPVTRGAEIFNDPVV